MELVAKEANDDLAKFINRFYRQVDNLIYSFKTKDQLYKIGTEIDRIMTLHNLPLQLKFSTNQANHFDFASDHPEEVLPGYNWDKKAITLIPNIVISHGHLSGGRKGLEIISKPFDPLIITKRIVLSVLSQLWNPLGIYYDPVKISLKIIYSKIWMIISGKDKKSFNTPVSQACADSAQSSAKAGNELVNLSKIQPMKQQVVPVDYDVK